jgi:hypothetical protein
MAMWEMWANPSMKFRYNSSLRKLEIVDDGEWVALGPHEMTGVVFSPYRYEIKQDAVDMLGRLYPNLRPEQKRVQRVACYVGSLVGI